MSALPIPQLQDLETTASFQTSPAEILETRSRSQKVGDRQKAIKFSRKQSASTTLVLLKFLQKGSAVLAVFTMVGSLAIYLSTVRIPQLWSQEYKSLEALQRQEQQLVAIDEALKYEIAQQAQEADLEMLPISSERTLFLDRSSVTPQAQKVSSNPAKHFESIPMGY